MNWTANEEEMATVGCEQPRERLLPLPSIKQAKPPTIASRIKHLPYVNSPSSIERETERPGSVSVYIFPDPRRHICPEQLLHYNT